MGRGDKKTKKGKIWKDSYGNSRRKKLIKAKVRRSASTKPVAAPADDSASKPKRTTAPKKKSDA